MTGFRESVWQFRWGRATFLAAVAATAIGLVAAVQVVQSHLLLALGLAGVDLVLCCFASYVCAPRWHREAEELFRKIRQEEGWWI